MVTHLFNRPVNVTALNEGADCSFGAVAQRLRVLHRAGIVGRVRSGKETVYQLSMGVECAPGRLNLDCCVLDLGQDSSSMKP